MNIRSSLIVLRAVRDWRMSLGLLATATISAVLLGPKSTRVLDGISFFGAPILAISLFGGLFEFSQRASVWTMLVQVPESDGQRSWSLIGSGAMVYAAACAVLTAGLVAGLALNPDVQRTVLPWNLLTFALWAAMSGAAVMLTSTMRRSGSAALSIGWLMTPFVLAMLQGPLGFSGPLTDALGFLAPPVNAAFAYQEVLRGKLPERALLYTAQLVSFPLLCLLVLGWRIATLSKPDQIRLE